jgi:hypothetical protein
LAKLAHLYPWFILVMAAIAGLSKLLLAKRVATVMHMRLQQPNAARRLMIGAGLTAFSAILFIPLYLWRRDVWLLLAVVYTFLLSAEFFFQSRYRDIDSLVFQNLVLGVLYTTLAISTYVLAIRV